MNQKLTVLAKLAARKPLRAACPLLYCWVTGMLPPVAFMWLLGSEHRFSCLPGEHFAQ